MTISLTAADLQCIYIYILVAARIHPSMFYWISLRRSLLIFLNKKWDRSFHLNSIKYIYYKENRWIIKYKKEVGQNVIKTKIKLLVSKINENVDFLEL